MARTTLPSPPGKRSPDRGVRIKRSFAQSTYVTTAWTWFMVLAGKAAEPVLVTSVLYASVKLLPIVHFPPQCDAVVFVAQFIALDVGGLSLNKLADQALQEGNTEGAKQAKRLSVALVSVMLAGVIIAGIDQVVKLDEQLNTIIDTILLIARAIMAVLYSRVIHALREDDLFAYAQHHDTDVQAVVAEVVHEALTALTVQMKAGQQEQIRLLCELLTAQSARLKDEQTELETRGMGSCETTNAPEARVSAKTTLVPRAGVSREQRSRQADHPETSRKKTAEHEVDQVVWPLLEAGKTVRGIAAETGIKSATVGRSRLRWTAVRGRVSASSAERDPLSRETAFNGISADEPSGEDLS